MECVCAHRIPGGSAANVMKGVANLSGGRVRCKFMGMVGTDSTAEAYRHKMQQQGVQPVLLVSSIEGCGRQAAGCRLLNDGMGVSAGDWHTCGCCSSNTSSCMTPISSTAAAAAAAAACRAVIR